MVAPRAGILYPKTVGPTRTDLVGQGVLKVPALTMEKYKAPSILDAFSGNKDAANLLTRIGIGMMANNDKGIWGSLAGGAQGYLDGIQQQRANFNEDQQLANQQAQQDFNNQATVLDQNRAQESHASDMAMDPLRKQKLQQEIENGKWLDLGNGWFRNRETGKMMQPPKEMLDQILALERAKAGINAAATPTHFTQSDIQLPNGTITSARWNPRSGEFEVKQSDGSFQPAPVGSQAVSDGAGGVITANQFNKLEGEITADEISLNKMVKYAEDAGSLPAGIDRMTNQLTTAWKTLWGDPLKADEFKQKLASGEVQSLVGALRLDVLGPGVLTEQDAQRLMNYLGGDPSSAFQNPEVLKYAMTQIVNDKMAGYQTRITQYNRAAPSYGAQFKQPTDYLSRLPKPKTPAGVNPPGGGTGVDFDAVDRLIAQ